MKKTSFNLGLLVVGAALLSGPSAWAQTDTTTGNTTTRTTTTQVEDDGPDLGWLGLLGLLGLAGLLKKPERQVVHHTDTVRTTGTGTGTGTNR